MDKPIAPTRREDPALAQQISKAIGVDAAGETLRERDDLHEQWIRALGYLTYSFGQLEWCSHAVFERYSDDGLTASAKDLLFKPRATLARGLIAARLQAPQHANLLKRWMSFFAALLIAADRRNGIVHNPLMLSIYIGAAGALSVEHGIHRLRKPDQSRIQLGEVESFNEQLTKLCEEMVELLRETGKVLPRDGDRN
jgi:hypothetical protein